MEERKLRILIADDEDGLRMSMAGILELEGYEVVAASDGHEAVNKAKEGSFDIAFLDIKMPGLNGVEAFKEIKKLSPETVVVMMTAYAVNDLIREAINEGAYACINKPFDMEKIIGTIRDVTTKPFVMVIDDDTTLCELMKERLKELGYNVITRSSGLEGLELVKRKIPDVVFMDVVMEGLDGVATFRKMKEILGNNCPKTIIMSAHDLQDKFEEAKNLGAAQCLQKPVDLGSLNETINQLLRTSTAKICVVDDDQSSCESLKKALETSGYDVDIATSGGEMIEKIKKELFKVVIVNMKQPDINGVEVYEKVKQIDGNVGVIFVDSAAGKLGGDVPKNNFTYLHKPFELDELIQLIEHIKRTKFTDRKE